MISQISTLQHVFKKVEIFVICPASSYVCPPQCSPANQKYSKNKKHLVIPSAVNGSKELSKVMKNMKRTRTQIYLKKASFNHLHYHQF